MFSKLHPTEPASEGRPGLRSRSPNDLPGSHQRLCRCRPRPRRVPARPRGLDARVGPHPSKAIVTGPGELVVDGTVRGDVKVARLTVGETGNVEGSVMADYVEVRGRVVGGVTGKQASLSPLPMSTATSRTSNWAIDVGRFYFQGAAVSRAARYGQAKPSAPLAGPDLRPTAAGRAAGRHGPAHRAEARGLSPRGQVTGSLRLNYDSTSGASGTP